MPLQGILWTAVSRNDIVIAEAGEDERGGAVIDLAKKILSKKRTAGWEFENNRKSGLKGIKFHVFEEGDHYTMTQGDETLICWSYSAVYDASNVPEDYVKKFLEKIIHLTEPLRETAEWQTGDVLCAQESFAPILLQKIQHIQTIGRIDELNKKIDTTKDLMKQNIDMMLDREETLNGIRQQSEELNGMAKMFKKRAKQIKRFKMVQNAKHGMVSVC
jgi:hypothetical protein